MGCGPSHHQKSDGRKIHINVIEPTSITFFNDNDDHRGSIKSAKSLSVKSETKSHGIQSGVQSTM